MTTLFNAVRFAETLRIHRDETGLRDAAKEINRQTAHKVSAATLSRYERGYPVDLLTFVALCNWMGVSPSVFFSDADEVSEPLPFEE